MWQTPRKGRAATNAQVEVYANASGFWVIRVALASVESEAGLAAYMAMLLRRHERLHGTRLAKVPEHWHDVTGDGCVYYARARPFSSAALWRPDVQLRVRVTAHPPLSENAAPPLGVLVCYDSAQRLTCVARVCSAAAVAGARQS